MAKNKITYTCQSCGGRFLQWAGRCGECGAWNSLAEEVAIKTTNPRQAQLSGYAAANTTQVTPLSEVRLEALTRFSSGIIELDRVLGGGVVQGSVVLMGGDPGIGKSTLLL